MGFRSAATFISRRGNFLASPPAATFVPALPAPVHLPVHLPVRLNQTLDYDGLRGEAEAAAEGHTQKALAERLGVSQPAISQAINRTGAKYAALQTAIIEELTDYTVRDETVPTFRVVRKT